MRACREGAEKEVFLMTDNEVRVCLGRLGKMECRSHVEDLEVLAHVLRDKLF